MTHRRAKLLSTATAIGLCLVLPLAAATDEAHAARFGGGRFGGFHGGGGHFGGFHAGGAHFGGAHFGRAHFGGAHFGHSYLGGAHFGARGAFGHAHFAGIGHGARGFAGHNAFGNRHSWAAWNHGAYGWGYGWAGPVFWPYFYGDLLSFALWPYDFYDPFFDYGPDYLFSSLFWPGYGYPYGWSENPYDIYASATAPEPTEYRAEADQTCSALAPGITDLPIQRIGRAIKPDDTQAAVLNDLSAAAAKAGNVVRSSCPNEPPLTPVSRLEADGKRFEALLQAVQIIRAPLTTLDNSLDDRQRKRFNEVALGARRRQTPAPASGLADLCAAQAKDFAVLPIGEIEETVKPNGSRQTGAFDALKEASAKAADSLASSCPAAVPATLTDRFNAISKRLDAMIGAVKTLEPPLRDFYASLNDEQKAQFNVMPPPSETDGSQAQDR